MATTTLLDQTIELLARQAEQFPEPYRLLTAAQTAEPTEALTLVSRAEHLLRPHQNQVRAYAWLLDAVGQLQKLTGLTAIRVHSAPVPAPTPTLPTAGTLLVAPSDDEVNWLARKVADAHNEPISSWMDFARSIWSGGNCIYSTAERYARTIRTLGYNVEIKSRCASVYHLEIRLSDQVIAPTELDRLIRIEKGERAGLMGEPSWDQIHEAKDRMADDRARRKWARRFKVDPDDLNVSSWERLDELDVDGEMEKAELYEIYCELGGHNDPVDDYEPEDFDDREFPDDGGLDEADEGSDEDLDEDLDGPLE